MTKMIKMSLIAAVAVTGMTSTVCAQPLEDAIKGVDVSGMLRYRYDDLKNTSNNTSTIANEYTMQANIKSKVNDMVTANVKIEALGVNAGASTTEATHATSDATGDRDVNLVVSKANFAANLGFATVIAGKQSVPSPFVDNTVDDGTRGTGAVALIPVGPISLAAGYFNNYSNTSDTGVKTYSGNAISALAVLGNISGVSFDAWHVNVDTVATAQSVGAKTSIAGITLDARTSVKNPDSAATETSRLSKLVASTKVGPVSLLAGYAKTSKGTNDVSVDGDKDTQAGFVVWQANAAKLSDASAYLVGASMEVMPAVTADVKYVTVDFGTGSESATETLVGLTYAMSKNFSLHTRYSMYDVKSTTGSKTTDSDKGRLELKYTF